MGTPPTTGIFLAEQMSSINNSHGWPRKLIGSLQSFLQHPSAQEKSSPALLITASDPEY